MASPDLGHAAAAGTGGGAGEEASLEDVSAIAGEQEPPADGVPAMELEGNEAGPLAEVPAVQVGGEETVPLDWVRAITVEEEDEALEEGDEDGEEEEEVKWLKHYSSMQSILIVGDGDFSFSRALAVAFCSAENLVATSLDSYEALTSKYSKAESNILVLKIMGATILHGINAKTMKLHPELKMRRFDRIVFNFPHAGFKGKEDHVVVIKD